MTLLVGFFSGSDVAVWTEDESVVVSVDGSKRELSRAEAAQLRAAIGEAASHRREFVHTAGEHRPDGSYAVERRGADSTGNAAVFDSFGAVEALYGRLPAEFGAEAVGREGITGSRRHMLVRHFAEHPAFDCAIESGSPLRVEKREGPGEVTADAAAD